MKISIPDWFHSASRTLRRRPLFTAGVVAALALGIGANTAIFTVVNAVILRQLPYHDPADLVWIWATRTDRDRAFFSIPDYLDFRAQSVSLTHFEAFSNWGVNRIGDGAAPRRLQGVRMTPGFFDMLGATPALGRLITPLDAAPDASKTVVLTFALWTREYGADPAVIGKRLHFNDDYYTVIGVTAAGFLFPGAEAELFGLLNPAIEPSRADRAFNFLRALGRVKKDASPQQVRADLAAIERRLRDLYPLENGKKTSPRVIPLKEELVGSYDLGLRVTFAAVALVLLVACANLGNLMMAGVSARAGDFAIRRALGASPARIAREMLAESLLLSILGAALGVLLAHGLLRALIALAPPDLPRLNEVAVDGTALLFTAAAAILAAAISGIAPALFAARAEPQQALRSRSRGGATTSPRWLRNAIVAGEMAASIALLVNTLLLVRSLRNLPDPGFASHGLIQTRVSLPPRQYHDADAIQNFCNAVAANLGTYTMAAANALPLSGLNVRTDFTIAGRPILNPTDAPGAQHRWVGPGYFRVLGIPLSRGREFADFDHSSAKPIAVVDESLVRQFFPNEDPIGAHIILSGRAVEIVGVAGAVRHFTLEEEPLPTLYMPIAQVFGSNTRTLASGLSIVSAGGRSESLGAERLRKAVQGANSSVPLSAVRPMDQFVSAALASRKFQISLLSVFSIAALLLAASGVYAVVAFDTRQRFVEFGIKAALGAPRRRLFLDALRRPAGPVAAGLAAGLAAAIWIANGMQALFYRTSPYDTATLAGVSALVSAAALLAVLIPARKVMSTDPASVVRNSLA